MRQLRGQDASFLYSDTGHSNANVTLLHIYDQSTAPGGKVRFKSILAHIESRLDRSPVFRQKLLHVPFELDFPYWIEDEDFDLEYHVRHIALPEPGDWRQFCIQVSRIHARPLDLSRPLWEIYVIEGLDKLLNLPRGSFALLTKLHHSAIDLDAGVEITRVLHDTTATPAPPEPPKPWFPETPPGSLALIQRTLMHNLLSPFRLVRPMVRMMTRLAPTAFHMLSDALLHPEKVPVTRFNAIVSPHRVFETRRFAVAEFDRIRSLVPGCTLDDAIAAVCAGGLRRYLAHHDELPEASLSAIASASLSQDHDDLHPEWRLVRLALGTDIADPLGRLRFVQARATDVDDKSREIDTGEWSDIAGHTPAATLALSAKLLGSVSLGVGRRAPLASCSITHVPGPREPMYLSGARLTYFSAIMPISDGMGLVFAVTSYDDMIIVSPTSCREQLPDPEFFARCVRDSFQEYLALTTPLRSASRAASASDKPGRAAPRGRTAPRRPRAARADRPRSTAPAR